MEETKENEVKNTVKSDNKHIVSLALGILSVALFIIAILSLPLGIIGLIFGIISRTKGGARTAGIVLSSIGIALTLVFTIYSISSAFSGFFDIFNEYEYDYDYDYDYDENEDEEEDYEYEDDEQYDYDEPDTEITNTFIGSGFELQYGSRWQKGTLSNGKSVLAYSNTSDFFGAIGKSALSEANVDFETYEGKQSLYNQFYTYWNDTDDVNYKIQKGSNGFSILKDNIYYATYDYGPSSYDIRGKYYLVIDPGNNIVLSFLSNANYITSQFEQDVLKLLQTIKITTKYDNELAGYLDSMTNWNKYSDLRQGTLGKKVDINGGWRILSNSETYWKFENGEFWWYKSFNDLDDNYWYGTTKIYTGRSGLTQVGLDENAVDRILANSKDSAKVTEDSIYAIVFTPTKIISGGVDKSSTNISGEPWKYVWILVDHCAEGIEAQVMNINTADTSYYVKISD